MDTTFEAEMRKYMNLRGCKSLEQLRKHTLIASNCTFLKRWSYPETFTTEDLNDMFSYLNIPREERLKIVGVLWGKQWEITVSD